MVHSTLGLLLFSQVSSVTQTYPNTSYLWRDADVGPICSRFHPEILRLLRSFLLFEKRKTANQPPSFNQNLRKTYDDLVANHTIVPDILFSPTTPTRALRDPTHSSCRLVFGPAILKNFPEQTFPLFPYNIVVRPAYQKQNTEWGEWSSLVCLETWCKTSQSA